MTTQLMLTALDGAESSMESSVGSGGLKCLPSAKYCNIAFRAQCPSDLSFSERMSFLGGASDYLRSAVTSLPSEDREIELSTRFWEKVSNTNNSGDLENEDIVREVNRILEHEVSIDSVRADDIPIDDKIVYCIVQDPASESVVEVCYFDVGLRLNDGTGRRFGYQPEGQALEPVLIEFRFKVPRDKDGNVLPVNK